MIVTHYVFIDKVGSAVINDEFRHTSGVFVFAVTLGENVGRFCESVARVKCCREPLTQVVKEQVVEPLSAVLRVACWRIVDSKL